MSRYFRRMINKKVTAMLHNSTSNGISGITSELTLKYQDDKYFFQLPLKTKTYDICSVADNIAESDHSNRFSSIDVKNNCILFEVPTNTYIKKVLQSNSTCVLPPDHMDDKMNVIVEFSSPNIAKPFHLGHFRSTVIGNCISNINTFLGHKVKKINYLGDWGKQFGLVQIGTQLEAITENDLKEKPLDCLYKAYVTANERLKIDPTLNDEAQQICRDLELNEKVDVLHNWELYKKYTIIELNKIYKRLGIEFDEYQWESMYRANQIEHLLLMLKQKQLLLIDESERIAIDIGEETVPLLRHDDTTLYLVRDLAAAIDRYTKNRFDVMYYVVDGTQTKHFERLIGILRKMEMPWATKLKHVRFGRISGISTRKGTSLFIENILNELQDIMRKHQQMSENSNLSNEEMDFTADNLAVTGLIIYELLRRKDRNYSFCLEDVIEIANYGIGKKLQYTHCRLTSLEKKSVATITEKCDPNYLKEKNIANLLLAMGKFDEAVLRSYSKCEPHILAAYTIRLASILGSLWASLPVKNQPPNIANNRLLLFHAGKNILAQSMRLLGITPLNKM